MSMPGGFMLNWFLKFLMSFALCVFTNAFADNVFTESFDISVGRNHVCAL
jgi:hypothetical protein